VLENAEFGPPRNWDTLALILPEVCKGCNNGWLSRIEDQARPILSPILFGNYALHLRQNIRQSSRDGQ
jgi:hypothetical protein